MATTIIAGNATNGLTLTPDNTGALELKTGTGAGTTALTLDSSQNATVAGTLKAAGVTTALYPLVSGTAVASTSGTSIDFTSLPSWVKRITISLNGVSTNGTSALVIRAGSGSIQATGYTSISAGSAGGAITTGSNNTTGFTFSDAASAASVRTGAVTLTLLDAATYKWSVTGIYADPVRLVYLAGGVTLTGVLDQVRVTTANGTDTFDAGSVNILYE